jgi:hypothetical protein
MGKLRENPKQPIFLCNTVLGSKSILTNENKKEQKSVSSSSVDIRHQLNRKLGKNPN